ncbi:hypothetical protein JKP88DRAFT_350605 [Tribonema minus]|uniref:Uncharacterized protein n=1 Tax=Tribonema minus TaxID=303371 RepID=A0A836C9N1_9STRA|nr:hypothetical protein JKP88DRAFT_350605 [Tribonema minus]
MKHLMNLALGTALNRGSRLWLLSGLVHVFAAVRALLGMPALDTEQLIGMVGGGGASAFFRLGGVYGGGALKSKAWIYINKYGQEEGMARFCQFYKEVKHAATIDLPADKKSMGKGKGRACNLNDPLPFPSHCQRS